MASDRVQRYLASLERRPAVPVAEVRRALEQRQVPPAEAWLRFHEQYAGYVEPLGLDEAVWGLVHARSRWLTPGKVSVSASDVSEAKWFVTCAESHPSYVYELGDTGVFREPEAASFEVRLERVAASVEFLARPGSRRWYEAPGPRLLERLEAEARVVAEGSDDSHTLYLGEKIYALRDAVSGEFIDGGHLD